MVNNYFKVTQRLPDGRYYSEFFLFDGRDVDDTNRSLAEARVLRAQWGGDDRRVRISVFHKTSRVPADIKSVGFSDAEPEAVAA